MTHTSDGTQPIDPAKNRLVAELDYRKGTDRILVMEGAEDQMPTATQPVVRHLRVAGHDAVVTDAEGTCVTWTVRPSVHEGVCSVGQPDSNLSTAEVVRVTRSLR